MPIKIPADLPAASALEQENIFIMTEDRASSQDIRPLEIAIVNLMPTKIATETQLLRLLGNTPIQVNITLLRASGHQSKHVPERHLERFYQTFDKKRNFDGMIITGAPVEKLEYADVDYWEELAGIMLHAQRKVYSTLYLCWAAQAALHLFYDIPKHNLPQKLSGIFCHDVISPDCPLFRGFDDQFLAPHSRHTEILAQDILEQNDLRILAHSSEAGAAIIEKRDKSQVFITGHLEYDRDTLDQEYRRDIRRGLNPQIPKHYYPADNPELTPPMTWRAHAHLFFSNWLNYYVYQGTPYALDTLGKD